MNLKESVLTLGAGACLALSLMCGQAAQAQSYNDGINIIPMPQSLVQKQGSFTLTDGTAIGATTTEAKAVAKYFAEKMAKSTGYNIPVANKGKITLTLSKSASTNNEGYQLEVSSKGVNVKARTAHGLFYGMQSFMQLLPAEIESPTVVKGIDWKAQAVKVSDSPRFGYRGVHVDPCRHFMTVAEMKKLIDVLAVFKINSLHWHLTEDQGWRIEIKKYPKLTTIGATRIDGEGTQYGPYFYTQDEVRDIVKYAADRYITIIPELEIPGHELAAIAAYPELSCEGKPITPRVIWGVEDVVMCPGKEEVFSFLQDVIDEMVALFPSTYFHIGGDECPKSSWKKCPLCQKRIAEEGLDKDPNKSPEEMLQTYVVHRIEKYLAKYGKKIIGWDEILEGKPAQTATIMSWRGEQGGIAAALAGHDAIMTPGTNGLYLDHSQGDKKIEPVSIGGYATLAKTYSYNPVPDTLVQAGKDKHIVGVQGNVWSEYLYNNAIREYMTFPRELAVAEVGWTNNNRKDYKDFERRINNAYVRLDGHGINYHIPMPEQPEGSCNHVAFLDKARLTFTTTRPETMVYTTDGSVPNAQSKVYTEPIEISQTTTVKIATLLPSGKMSKVRKVFVEKQGLSPAKQVENKQPGLVMEVTGGNYLTTRALENSGKEVDSVKVITKTRALTAQTPSPESMRGVKQYAAVAKGYVDIPADGVYFISSDLEEVWIDGELLVNNSGETKRFSRNDNSMALAKGLHEIKAVFLGHIIGGWPSNWNDGSILLRASDADEFQPVTPEMLWH